MKKNQRQLSLIVIIWNYAVRGKTKIDKLDARIIVSFDEDGMLIITAMYVGGI